MISWSQNVELLFDYTVLRYLDKLILIRISTSGGGYPGIFVRPSDNTNGHLTYVVLGRALCKRIS